MTVLYKIQIAKISQYLAAASNANGGLFGQPINPLLPIQLYIERKAVEYRYDYEGITAAVAATSTFTVDSLGNAGDEYVFTFDDPDLGEITLGTYEEQVTDTTVAILAASISAELNDNAYSYTFTVLGNVITCSTPTSVGASANGTAVVCTITPAVVALSTIASGNVNAAPSSADWSEVSP